jgi:hypothetical protein
MSQALFPSPYSTSTESGTFSVLSPVNKMLALKKRHDMVLRGCPVQHRNSLFIVQRIQLRSLLGWGWGWGAVNHDGEEFCIWSQTDLALKPISITHWL